MSSVSLYRLYIHISGNCSIANLHIDLDYLPFYIFCLSWVRGYVDLFVFMTGTLTLIALRPKVMFVAEARCECVTIKTGKTVRCKQTEITLSISRSLRETTIVKRIICDGWISIDRLNYFTFKIQFIYIATFDHMLKIEPVCEKLSIIRYFMTALYSNIVNDSQFTKGDNFIVRR